MRAKLIRIIEPQNGLPWYYREYVYECAVCGKEYTRNSRNSNVSPYCGLCQLKHKAEKDRKRREKKVNDLINNKLYEIRQEITEIPRTIPQTRGFNQREIYSYYLDVLGVIDKHIEEE